MAVLVLIFAIGCWVTSTTGAIASTAATVRSYENDTIFLPCHVEDLGLQTRVRWWRGEELLADSEEPVASTAGQRIKMWGNRSLELVQVRPEDSGQYTCKASRPEPWGHVTQVHEIQVMYPASIKVTPESGQLEVDLGQEAIMSCEMDGVPKPTLKWSFQGEELPVIPSGQKLHIHASNSSLAGVYSCEANNGIGDPAKASIELRIRHKPEVTASTSWQHSAPGIRAQLECLVVGWPEAKVEWLFEGKELPHSQRILRYKKDEPRSGGSGQRHGIILRSSQSFDFGQYVCKATNKLGSSEALIDLSWLPRPPVLKKESRTASGTSYNFIWTVDSYSPIVEYLFWFRQLDSQEDWRRLVIPSEHETAGPLHARSFNLTGLKPSRQYEAYVMARNLFGWSSPSKIVRFATLSVPATEEEAYKIDKAGHEQIPPAVQVTSDSHRSSVDTNSSCGCLYRNDFLPLPLLLLLLLLVVFVNSSK